MEFEWGALKETDRIPRVPGILKLWMMKNHLCPHGKPTIVSDSNDTSLQTMNIVLDYSMVISWIALLAK